MTQFIEHLFAKVWNKAMSPKRHPVNPEVLMLGSRVIEGQVTDRPVWIAQGKRPEHIVILGKTGSGKSVLLRHMAYQDIKAGRGFCFFDLHGDATAKLLRAISQQEQLTHDDLSRKTIVIEPADREYSVGLNVLQSQGQQHSFVQIAEFAQILKVRWNLDSFGARTEELLRNSLHVLADNNMTLLELGPLLTSAAFRATLLRQAQNLEVKQYFENRFDRASEAMQAVFRDALLNKVSAFTADPHFRHIVGQQVSTFSLAQAIDDGYWIIVNLDKGRLGEQAATLGSLLLTKIKNALFTRRKRQVFSLYCDEIQNLAVFDGGLDTLLSEARKFGISLTTANQFMAQHSTAMQAALMSAGSHIFFQLASQDADKLAQALDGNKSLSQTLKNLPQRHLILKSGSQGPFLAKVPDGHESQGEYQALYERCRSRWARRRTEVEAAISQRSAQARQTPNEVINDWQ
jgi:energy-coupling factor transporter ATP-binding protein EcfA2